MNSRIGGIIRAMSSAIRLLIFAIVTFSFCVISTLTSMSTTTQRPQQQLQQEDVLATNCNNDGPAKKTFYIGDYFVANFFRAAQFCTYHGMELASIDSQHDEYQLEGLLKAHGYQLKMGIGFWLGGTTLAAKGKFYWLSNGVPFTYTNWGPNEPNDVNGTENCAHMAWSPTWNRFVWNDVDCATTMYFVCQARK